MKKYNNMEKATILFTTHQKTTATNMLYFKYVFSKYCLNEIGPIYDTDYSHCCRVEIEYESK